MSRMDSGFRRNDDCVEPCARIGVEQMVAMSISVQAPATVTGLVERVIAALPMIPPPTRG